MKQSIIVLISLLSFSSLYGQKDSSLVVKGEIGLRGLWQTGTLNQLIITPIAKLMIENNRWHLEGNSRYDFFLVNGNKVKNDLWSDIYIQYNPNKKIYPFISSLTGFSQSFQMDYSTQLAIGVGTNLIKRMPNHYLQANIGAGYFNLKYMQKNAHHAISIAPMVKVRTPIFGKRIAFSMDVIGYLSLMDTDYFGLHNQVGLHMFLAKGFSIHLNHTTFYNNINAENIAPTNTRLLFGLTYSFI